MQSKSNAPVLRYFCVNFMEIQQLATGSYYDSNRWKICVHIGITQRWQKYSEWVKLGRSKRLWSLKWEPRKHASNTWLELMWSCQGPTATELAPLLWNRATVAPGYRPLPARAMGRHDQSTMVAPGCKITTCDLWLNDSNLVAPVSRPRRWMDTPNRSN